MKYIYIYIYIYVYIILCLDCTCSSFLTVLYASAKYLKVLPDNILKIFALEITTDIDTSNLKFIDGIDMVIVILYNSNPTCIILLDTFHLSNNIIMQCRMLLTATDNTIIMFILSNPLVLLPSSLEFPFLLLLAFSSCYVCKVSRPKPC